MLKSINKFSCNKKFFLIADASKVEIKVLYWCDIKTLAKRKFEIFTHNGTKTGLMLDKFLDDIKQLDIGELVITVANDDVGYG